MQTAVEIAFHNCEATEAVEKDIRARIDKLGRIFDRLLSCRVRVDQRNDNGQHRIPPVVRIEMSVPGHGNLIVSHEAEHLQRRFATPDIHNAIHEAFRIAERRLAAFKEQLRDHTSELAHEAVHEFPGEVAEIVRDRDFGFVVTKEGGLLYFHRNSVLNGDFDTFGPGTEVTYVEEMGDTGPTAKKVRLRSRAGGQTAQ